jgi:hypothetical protein
VSKAQQDIRRKIRALEHAARTGNIRQTCRYFGMKGSMELASDLDPEAARRSTSPRGGSRDRRRRTGSGGSRRPTPRAVR